MPFTGLIWLLSEKSNWLPERYRNILIQGISERDLWLTGLLLQYYNNPFLSALMNKTRRQFSLTTKVKNGLRQIVEDIKKELKITEDSEEIISYLLKVDIINRYYDSQDKLKRKRGR